MTRLTALAGSLALTLSLSVAPAALAADTIAFDTIENAKAANIVLYLDDDLTVPNVGGLMDTNQLTALNRAISAAKFQGKFGAHKTFYGVGDFDTVTVMGTGDQSLTRRQLHDLGGHSASAPGDGDILIVANNLNTVVNSPASELAFGYKLGDYRFDTYKTGKTGQKGVVNVPNDDRDVTFLVANPAADQAKMDNEIGRAHV